MELGKDVYVFRRGKKGLYTAQFRIAGRRFNRATGKTDRAEALIAGHMIRNRMICSTGPKMFPREALLALMPDETARQVFTAWLDYQNNVPKALRMVLLSGLKSLAAKQPKFAGKLFAEQREWTKNNLLTAV